MCLIQEHLPSYHPEVLERVRRINPGYVHW